MSCTPLSSSSIPLEASSLTQSTTQLKNKEAETKIKKKPLGKIKEKKVKSKSANQPLEDATLEENSLKDGLRVLSRIDGHFYPGRLNCIKPPDIYGILLDNERGFRPHIYAREELLKSTIKDIRIRGEKLPVGTRVCAYWSSKYQFMHPGTVVPHEPGSTKHNAKFVNVELDDGDSRELNLEQVRLLPYNYPHVVYQDQTVSHSPGKRKPKPLSPQTDTKPKPASRTESPVNDPHPEKKGETNPEPEKMSSDQKKKDLDQDKADNRGRNMKPLIGKKIEVPSSGNIFLLYLLMANFSLSAFAKHITYMGVASDPVLLLLLLNNS